MTQTLELDLSQFVSRQIYYFGVFEPAEVDFVGGYLKRGMVVLDVGANIGQYTLLAAKRVGINGKVHSFEPSTANYARLARNVERNGWNSVAQAYKVAIGSAPGLALLALPADGGSNWLGESGDTPTEQVEVTTLDLFVSQNGINRVDFVKIDAEGADLEVLKGGVDTLRRLRPFLFVEFAGRTLQRFSATPTDMLEFILGCGYTGYRLETGRLVELRKTDDIWSCNLFFRAQ